MMNLYPPLVDQRNPTIGGLRKYPPLVDTLYMTTRPDYRDIGERLEAIREGFSDLNQRDWALRNNYTPTQYNNWEKGTRRISVDAAEMLAEKYGVTLDYIFLGRLDGLSENARKVI